MSQEQYLETILTKYTANINAAQIACEKIYPTLKSWGGDYLLRANYSGSIAKNTSTSLGSDADIFISLSSNTDETLANIYDTLFSTVQIAGYTPRKQNVSIGVTVNGYSIDLVPGRRISQYGNEHNLYKRKTGTWTKTDVLAHVNYVKNSGRLDEIKILKIWRHLHNLSFPSFYLEMAVIDALHYKSRNNLEGNVITVLEYLSDNITTKRFIDPANNNNVISDDCTALEKSEIAQTAKESRSKPYWSQIIW